MYKVIRQKVIVDERGVVVNKYGCQKCNNQFLAVDSNVVCECQKSKVIDCSASLYYAIHNNNQKLCAVIKKRKNKIYLIAGFMPAKQYTKTLLGLSPSDFSVTNAIDEALKHSVRTRGRRLTPEQKQHITSQAQLLTSSGTSLRHAAKLLNIDRQTLQKLLE